MASINYAPARYEVEGVVRSNDIEAVDAIFEYLYSVEKNHPEHILHLYWYEGIGYTETPEDYPIDSEGYAHAAEFNGLMTEEDFNGLVWLLKELSTSAGWAIDLDGEAGEYSDADKNTQFELKVSDLEDAEATA